jgi:hypothetical protein
MTCFSSRLILFDRRIVKDASKDRRGGRSDGLSLTSPEGLSPHCAAAVIEKAEAGLRTLNNGEQSQCDSFSGSGKSCWRGDRDADYR